MSDEWTSEDEATFRPLKRKYDRIHRKGNRDKQRKRPYKPRLKKEQTMIEAQEDWHKNPFSNIHDYKSEEEKKA